MLEKLIYQNHKGEKLESEKDGIYVNHNDLRDYLWDYQESSGRITGFSMGVVKKNIPIIIVCGTKEESLKIKNRIMEIADIDVITKKPGKFIINGYYLEGYIIGNSKTDYLWDKRFLNASLTFITDYPVWCKEKRIVFPASSNAIIKEEQQEEREELLQNSVLETDFPHDYDRKYITKYSPAKKRYLRDYSYDYYYNHTVRRLDNDNYCESDFKMYVYGPCIRPGIWIGEHLYQVNVIMTDGEYMVIDSKNRTIIKYSRNGNTEDLFNARDKISYIFQKIPSGKSFVKWNANYPFELVLYQERREPPWNV